MLESSKSAMKTFAPELSALMIILRSTGPVISTRRSRMSAGMGATVQSRLADLARSRRRKSGFSPASRRFCRSWRACSNSLRRGLNVRCRSTMKATASGVRICA